MLYGVFIKLYIVKNCLNHVHPENSRVDINYCSVHQFSCEDSLTMLLLTYD